MFALKPNKKVDFSSFIRGTYLQTSLPLKLVLSTQVAGCDLMMVNWVILQPHYWQMAVADESLACSCPVTPNQRIRDLD